MKKSRIFLSFILCMFFGSGLTVTAQQNDYEWSWATRGGGPRDLSSNAQNPPSSQHSQKINAIAIDHANNYYFLADIGSENAPGTATTFGNIPNDTIAIPTYNDPGGSNYYSRDTYLVSTTCEGEFRWHKTIGGGGDVYSHGLGTDNMGGIYVAGYLDIWSSWQTPVHYAQDSIKGLPVGGGVLSPNNKSMYLIKYNAEGEFQWLKEPQVDDTPLIPGQRPIGKKLYVEGDGTIHWLVALSAAHSYENGSVVVDSVQYHGQYIPEYGVLKYDKDGNFLDYVKFPLKMLGGIELQTSAPEFSYDPLNNQYYLTAKLGFAHINGIEVIGDFYLAAFNAHSGDVVWWHQGDDGFITAMDIDGLGNVYLTGTCTPLNNNSFAGYTFTHPGASRAFLMKLDSAGQLLWGTNAETNSPIANAVRYTGDEVVIGLGLASTIPSMGWHWDGLEFVRPSGYGIDPGILRFDKHTGAALAIHDIVGAGTGRWDNIRAVAVDRAGHIVAGGLMTSPFIFKDHPVVPQLDRMAVSKSDFFIAQLAKTGVSCDDLVGVEDVQKPKLRIYPNPAGDLLHWQADVGIVAVTLYDLYGRMVKQHPATGQSGTLSVDSLSTGSYIVVLKSENGQTVQKILIKE